MRQIYWSSKMKSITLELPDRAAWIAQNYNGGIYFHESEPFINESHMIHSSSGDKFILGAPTYIENWRESKINLNTHGAYIDANGILHRCELVPDMLKPQAD